MLVIARWLESLHISTLRIFTPFLFVSTKRRSFRKYIFIHGGGNFGDLWPEHQQFREMILQRYPDRPVIQLPQSIHFQDKANIAKVRSHHQQASELYFTSS